MLESIRLIAATQRRTRRRTLVFLTVLVALVSGLSMALVAGARRSGSVVERFYARGIPVDASAFDASSVLTERDLAGLPGVERVEPFAYVALFATRRDGTPIGFVNGAALDFAALQPTTRLVSGRLPRSSHPFEIAVNEPFVEQYHLGPGDTMHARMFAADQLDQVSNGVYQPAGPDYRFRIAGVMRLPEDIGTDEVRGTGDSAQISGSGIAIQNGFFEAHRHEFLNFGEQYELGFTGRPPSRDQLELALASLTPAGTDPPILFPPEDDTHRGAIAAPVDVETTALLALGIGIALAGLVVIALVMRTEQRIHDGDSPTLRALGVSARQIAAAAGIRTLPAAAAGGVVALLIAILLSPLFPIGIGRRVELDAGIRVDGVVLAVGVLVTIVSVAGLAFVFGHPGTARGDRLARRSGVSSWLAAVDAPIGWSLGAYLAFARGSSRRTVPTRPVIAGGILLVAIMVGLGVYGSGVDHAYATPDSHGWRWDAQIGNVNFALRPDTRTAIADDPDVVASTSANYGQVFVGGESAEVLAFDPRGDAPPAVTAGRLPRRAHEIALGAATLRHLGLHLGDSVRFTVADGEFDNGEPTHTIKMRIVGRALPPILGESDIGDVGIATFDAIAKSGGTTDPRFVFVDLRTGRDPAGIDRLDRRFTEEIHTDTIPARVVSLHRVRTVWRAGVALLAAMLVLLLGYLLAVTARARRHDFAVLRTLGLRHRQVRSSLAAQATIVTLVMLVVGLPVGTLIGRGLWRVVTSPIGLVYDGAPAPAIAAVAAIAAIAATIAAVGAGQAVRHGSIAEPLRSQ